MTEQSIFHTLTCENCFETNDCETRIEAWLIDDEQLANVLTWACPVCEHRHKLELEANVAESIHTYNKHIRAISTGLNRAAKSIPKEPDKERLAYEKRLKDAKELDKAEGGNKHAQRVEFGYWVRRLRLGYGTIIAGPKLSTDAAARAAGISRKHWARLELGQEGYSEETVLLISAVVGGTVERAYEVAGLTRPPRLLKEGSSEKMQAALERYRTAMEIEDDTQWLMEALMARRSFRIAKVGLDKSPVLDIPLRAYAVASADRAIKAINKIPKQADRINVFRVVALANLTPDKHLRWIQEIVMHVLTGEQQRKLLETLLQATKSPKAKTRVDSS